MATSRQSNFMEAARPDTKIRLQVSVRNLVEFSMRSGDLSFEFTGVNRSVDAIRAHQKIQRSRPADYQAEVTLRRLLRADSQDVDSRLMLATLLRRTGRLDEARRELARLEQLEGSEKWQLEIEQEHKRIERLLAEGSAGTSPDDGEEATDLTAGNSEELTESSEAA